MTPACGVCLPATADTHKIIALLIFIETAKYPVLDSAIEKLNTFVRELRSTFLGNLLTGNRSAARAVSEPSGCCREESLPLEDRRMHVKMDTGQNEGTFCTQRKSMTHLDIPLNWSARLPQRGTAAEY